jgi:hypothetical protein
MTSPRKLTHRKLIELKRAVQIGLDQVKQKKVVKLNLKETLERVRK